MLIETHQVYLEDDEMELAQAAATTMGMEWQDYVVALRDKYLRKSGHVFGLEKMSVVLDDANYLAVLTPLPECDEADEQPVYIDADGLEVSRKEFFGPIKRTPKPAKKASTCVIAQHLDRFPESAAFPFAFSRSALFSVKSKRAPRELLVRKEFIIYATKSHIIYTGTQLSQDDADVMLFLIGEARNATSGTVTFRPRKALKDMGWTVHSTQVRRLLEALTRLQMGVLRQTNLDGSFISVQMVKRVDGSLVVGNKSWSVEIDESIIQLFNTGYSFVSQYQRSLLPREGLARWMHAFYRTHSKPEPIKIALLKKLCGSVASLKEFNRLLDTAMTKVMRVGAIKGFHMTEDSLVVKK